MYEEAIELAKYGHLPADFDKWDLADRDGWTVAHVAAACGHLPADFDKWDITDGRGWTVAHVAAEHGHLPADFDKWDLLKSNNLPADFTTGKVVKK